jgi:hypothetical protein
MSDKGWKAFERRLARDVGVERIPVTGERHGADFEDAMFCYQAKLRRIVPSWLDAWLAGIRGNAAPKGKIGVLLLKRPRMRDDETLVVLSWRDWIDLHGEPKSITSAALDMTIGRK